MNAQLGMRIALLGGAILLCTLCGCPTKGPSPETTKPPARARPSLSELSWAAQKTVMNCDGVPGTEGGIAPVCWTDPIKALNPIRVYTHRVNVVVVQRVHEGIEEGKYIYIPISSYLPQSGDDGFEFTPDPRRGNTYTWGDGVFDFKRTISKQ